MCVISGYIGPHFNAIWLYTTWNFVITVPADALAPNGARPFAGSADYKVNPLHAKFFRGIINIYLRFMSLLHIDVTQVLKILPHVLPGPTYTT